MERNRQIKIPPRPPEDWRVILDIVIEGIVESEKFRVKQRLNAITAIAFSKNPKGSDPDIMYLTLIKSLGGNFSDDGYLLEALNHPRFLDYAIARIYDRAGRK